jgi:acetyl esterase/lipase
LLNATGKPGSDLPVIVFFHGGAWVASDRDDPGRVHRRFLSSLVARGFDCINANYRRLGCSATKLVDCIDDVASVLDFIVTHNIANAFVRGVVLVGHSAGGHLILQAQMAGHLNRFQPHLRGIYSIGGVYDLVDFRKRCSTFLKLFAMRQFAKLSDEELLRLSPRHTRFLGTCCPVRLLHGDQEGFLLVQAQEYLLALQAQKFRASLRVFSGLNHFSLLRPSAGSEGVLGAHESVVPDLADFAAECSHSYVKLRNSRAAQA